MIALTSIDIAALAAFTSGTLFGFILLPRIIEFAQLVWAMADDPGAHVEHDSRGDYPSRRFTSTRSGEGDSNVL